LPVFSPTQGSLGHRAIHTHPRPVQSFQFVIGFQTTHPERLEDAGCLPFLKTPVGRRTGTDARGIQGIPLGASPKDMEDRVHGIAVIHPRTATAVWVRILVFRQQGLNKRPQIIRHTPSLR